jgi:hypothetical protein
LNKFKLREQKRKEKVGRRGPVMGKYRVEERKADATSEERNDEQGEDKKDLRRSEKK